MCPSWLSAVNHIWSVDDNIVELTDIKLHENVIHDYGVTCGKTDTRRSEWEYVCNVAKELGEKKTNPLTTDYFGSFNDTVSSWDHVGSNGRMIGEKLNRNDVEGSGRGLTRGAAPGFLVGS
jgi:hypothetical protein